MKVSTDKISGEQQLRAFDAGVRDNLRRYHSTRPPSYNLSLVKVPVHIFYGQNDKLAAPKVLQL